VAQVSKPAVSPISKSAERLSCVAPEAQQDRLVRALDWQTACGFRNPRYGRFGNLRDASFGDYPVQNSQIHLQI